VSASWSIRRRWPLVELEVLDSAGVARIVLNRPEKRNALNAELVQGVLEALEEVRSDESLRVVITRGAGPAYSAGLDLYYLREASAREPADWDRPTATVTLFRAVRAFPRVTIAQVHGHCLGGSLALMNSHDLVVAARAAQIGMPEILRGSFGQMATSTLYHAGIPAKKAALIQLTGENLTGEQADRLGLVSMVVDDADLEAATTQLARQIATRHPAALATAKIAAQMGRDLPLDQAMQLDRLLGGWQRLAVDPLAEVGAYLDSQRGGTNLEYRRTDT
jgi:enoyl-CoA hydratase/carnithine racemase